MLVVKMITSQKIKKSSFENDKILFEYINENLVAPKNLIELSTTFCPKIKSIIHFSSLYGLKSLTTIFIKENLFHIV